MKKLHVLIPSLLALSSASIITLIGCGPKTPTEEVTFNFSTETLSETKANVILDWEPSEESIVFIGDPHATCSTINISDARYVGGEESKPQTIELIFSEPIDQELNDVSIEFNYNDKTQKQEKHSKIDNIHIDKYNPQPSVTKVEWDFVEDGFYEATEVREQTSVMQVDAFRNYLSDISGKPKIFIDDVLNTENSEYFSLIYVFRANVETYHVIYEISSFNPDQKTITLKIDRDVSYTYNGEQIQIKTDLTLTNIKCVGNYSFTNVQGKVANSWSFVPCYYGLGIDDFKDYMAELDTDWEINGTISFPSVIKIDYDWEKEGIKEKEIDTNQLIFLNQEFYGIDNSCYYSQCSVLADYTFIWKEEKEYCIDIGKDQQKSYLGCDFQEQGFEDGDYSVLVLDQESKAPVPNLNMNCNLNGNYVSLHTDSNGKAEIGQIEKDNNLILHLMTWPSTHEGLTIKLVKNN